MIFCLFYRFPAKSWSMVKAVCREYAKKIPERHAWHGKATVVMDIFKVTITMKSCVFPLQTRR